MARGTHHISLSVVVSNARQWTEVYTRLCEVSAEFARKYSDVAVTSAIFDDSMSDDPELYADDETMHKVMHELLNAGLDGDAATHAISAMQNLGIVFQERL